MAPWTEALVPIGDGLKRVCGENVEAARDEYEQALREFELILEQFPLAVPSSDGVLQLRNAGAARSAAMERYQLARHRFHDLLLNDIVPDELDDGDGST